MNFADVNNQRVGPDVVEDVVPWRQDTAVACDCYGAFVASTGIVEDHIGIVAFDNRV